jgi:two-component system, OmpR family, response regulator ResD
MKILVIEDDPVVCETIALYLRQEGFDVTTAHDGAVGLQLALAGDVQLIVLDLMIPGMSGIEICRRVRASGTLPVLMLTARVSEEDRLAGFDAGADDYVPKPFSPREIVARVHALLRRAGTVSPVPPPPVTIADLEVDLWAKQVRVSRRVVAVTATEFRILAALARHPGRVFTRDELIARVFGPVYDGLDRTVDVHITNLRKKIEPNAEPRYVLTVHGIGYRLATSSDV